MLHPSQFEASEAWIAFQLNGAPIHTESDGDLNLIALMDAASCFILSSMPIPASADGPSKQEAKRLLQDAQASGHELPRTLFVPTDLPGGLLTVQAERHGVTVVRVSEDQLVHFIGEAREYFREHFGGGGAQ